MERDLTSGSPSCACPTNCWDYVYSGGGSRRDVRYLTICFIGIPFITAYNIISSIFRGMGDSKSPMYFKGRSSGVPAGRFQPGIFCCNHDFCKPARTDRCGSSWNCGEDHQYFIPCSIVYDVYNLSTCGAEYRSGKTRPCKADIKICADDYGDIWINYDDYR